MPMLKPKIYRRLNRIYPILFLVVLTYLLYSTFLADHQRQRHDHSALPPRQLGNSIFEDADALPLITLVGFFKGPIIGPQLVPWFFRSVGRQPHALDFLLIQREGCEDLSKWTSGMANVKHVCMGEEEFWQAHVDYLCKKFKGGCTSGQRKIMLKDMMYFGKTPNPQAIYPILRGWVFDKYIDPRSALWGYCDLDTFLGDFSQTFPYDLLDRPFDVFMPSETTDGAGIRLVFMRGHMTLFRRSPITEKKLLAYEGFQSFEDWDIGFIQPQHSIGEANYSSFVVRDPHINLLTFDSLALPHDPRMSGEAGVLSLPLSFNPKGKGAEPPLTLPPDILKTISTPPKRLPRRPTFTEEGFERSVEIIKGVKPPKRGLWFHESCANWYDALSVPKRSETGKRWKRYVMKVDDVWTERVEPMREFVPHHIVAETDDAGGGQGGEYMSGMYEWLYVHWQEDKKRAHFKEFPQRARGDIFVNHFYQGNALYDSETGNRVEWAPYKKESCTYMGCVPFGDPPLSLSLPRLYELSLNGEIEEWYAESKRIRMGISTATLGLDPVLLPTPNFDTTVSAKPTGI
ncbi:hypothetical protein I317_04503 [Kwoniella heveanensis CBS 569]|uniref:Uncharacterized protein n=1 Tax=Kwoniella heveanensis BCC8398 TaxID=1296120 RepID=A0A1B9H298_9TREE|nr:hypothetical protein I316_00509 [Kwoniella heveanensis BCC8398]OCF41697.1 hypothetical protein I317_04503 [Kwoniella heveanensis CBS 569]